MSNHSVRRFLLSLAALPLGLAMAGVAMLLMHLVHFVTNLAFFGKVSAGAASPAVNHLGLWVVLVPVLGGLIVGVMARYGSAAIRGHGIPEAMEQILENGSRIPARMTWLKPLSAAISIGTGGPFGAEGPIIATGGASGSLIGQLFSTTASERKTLLAAGAAAGMSATFGCPVSAVLLAVELLLFEFKPRSFVPVALASAVAAAARNFWDPGPPVFVIPSLSAVGLGELGFYLVLGVVIGGLAVLVTRIVYAIEDGFEHLPVHWMWWPALGAVVVGLMGYIEPRTLGVGYDNISNILNVSLPLSVVVMLCALKFVSWSVSLGSGTSGGTLAPLLTFGSGTGLVLGSAAAWLMPVLHIQPHLSALVGMAALFAGASQALLASVVFACETTGQVNALLPLLAACSTALITARFLARESIMSEKIARRGISVPSQYEADVYAHTAVSRVMETKMQTFPAATPAKEMIARIAMRDAAVCRGQAYLLTDPAGKLAGIVTHGDLMKASELALMDEPVIRFGNADLIVTFPDESLHTAIEKILLHQIGRLPVVSRDDPKQLVGYLSRSAILSARWKLINEESHREPGWFRQKGRSIKLGAREIMKG